VTTAAIVRRVTSRALQRWQTIAQDELDQIEAAHVAVGGASRGRRYATLQVNHAYVMLLSSQFQRFCRELHTEALGLAVAKAQPPPLGSVLQVLMMQGRKLDHGNANPSNIGADFSRLGMSFWRDVAAADARTATRQKHLEMLNAWRNAIAHQDWQQVGGNPALLLKTVQGWRSACCGLAESFDTAVAKHLTNLADIKRW
jgi:hypothetical protein